MTIRTDEIVVGKTYKFVGCDGKRLKPRTVVWYDRYGTLPGGTVRSHTGKTKRGSPSQGDTMAGSYFAEHAEKFADGEGADK